MLQEILEKFAEALSSFRKNWKKLAETLDKIYKTFRNIYVSKFY